MFSLTGESHAVYQVVDAPFDVSGGSRLHLCHDQAGNERIAKLYPAAVTDPEAAGWVRAAAARGVEAGGTAESSVSLPIDVLADGQAVIGVVLPVVPRPYLRADGRPRTFDLLSASPADPPPAAFRVGVLISVCEILAALAEAGLVHGALSPRNVLWRQDRPRTYLVDCDGLRPAGDAAAGDTDPRWSGRRITAPDEHSDRYGLALLVYRGLLLNPDMPTMVGQTWHRPAGGDLDPRLRVLFDGVFDDPYAADARPTAAQWRDTLREVFLGEDGTGYRQEALDALDRALRPAGESAAPTPPASPDPDPAGTPGAATPGGLGAPAPGGPWPGVGPMPPYGVLPGARRPASSNAPLIAAAVIAPIVVVGVVVLGAVILLSQHSGSRTGLGANYPYPNPAGTVPFPDPSTTVPDPVTTAPDPVTTAPYPDPATTAPYPDPTTPYYQPPPPPPMHYGAIAVARDGSTGKAWDYGSTASADQHALDACPRSDCKVLVTFVNSCGAVAYNPSTNLYWGGQGDSQTAAESSAISHAGGGHWITWVCTTR